jgi:membrane fusion protein
MEGAHSGRAADRFSPAYSQIVRPLQEHRLVTQQRQDLELAPSARVPGLVGGPRQALFRVESLQERRTLWLGRQTISLGLPSAVTSVASTILLCAAALLVAFGTYARRETLHGVMLPSAGLVEVAAPAAGWVETLHVAEGDPVASGTPLYTLNTDLTTRGGGAHQRIVQSLQAERVILEEQIARKSELANQEETHLQQKMQNLTDQIRQMYAQIAVKQGFVTTLAKDFADYTRYLKTGIGNLNEKNIQQQNWMRSEDDLQDLKSRSLRLAGDRLDTQTKLDTLRLNTANEIDQLRSKISEIDQRIADAEVKHAAEIVSSAAGRVTAVAAQPGQVVQAGARMVTIVPEGGKLEAQLLAPSTSVGFIPTGARVLLRYAAFPYQKFGSYWGTVTEISRASLQPEELKTFVPSIPDADKSKTFYKVVVVPDNPNVMAYGREQPVEVSMQVEAGVLLEPRAIYEWILEPLYGFQG